MVVSGQLHYKQRLFFLRYYYVTCYLKHVQIKKIQIYKHSRTVEVVSLVIQQRVFLKFYQLDLLHTLLTDQLINKNGGH